jgi:elongation factor 1-delta
MVNSEALARENVWYDKFRYEDAERQHFEILSKGFTTSSTSGSVSAEIMKAREHIKSSLSAVEAVAAGASSDPALNNRLKQLEKENSDLKKVTDELRALVLSLDSRVKSLEGSAPVQAPVKPSAPAPAAAKDDDDDDDVDLFGDDDEDDEEAERIKAERVAAYAAKKSNKPVLIAKSSILLDVKPWDDETDMKAIEEKVREIKADGLLWGASKLVPLAYGIKKLTINCIIADDKISVDWLTETIQENEDLVQSVDIAAFNKI